MYETDAVLAFLGPNPLAHARILMIPKVHEARIQNLEADIAAADTGTVGIHDGESTGQMLPHERPRFDDGRGVPILAVAGDRIDLDSDQFDALADSMASTTSA